MLDVIKKAYFLGMGIFSETKEKVESVVDDLIKKGEVAAEDRTNVIQDFLDKAKEQEQVIANKITQEVQAAIDKLGLATKKDLDKLEKKIDALKKEAKTEA
jgi:polyhydroxyalkanoate synthesis regulator phasin